MGLVGLEFRVYVPGIRAIIRAVVSVDEFGRLVALEFGVVMLNSQGLLSTPPLTLCRTSPSTGAGAGRWRSRASTLQKHCLRQDALGHGQREQNDHDDLSMMANILVDCRSSRH